MNSITYMKERQLSIFAKALSFTDIPVLQSAQVSFYQKYIILILQNGLVANDEGELITALSNMINVSKTCVREFVEYLNENNYLLFDERNKKYLLSSSVNFQIEPKYNNAMFAELDVKRADCDKILYVGDVDKFFLDSDFDETIFRKKGIGDVATTISSIQLNSALARDQDLIRSLIIKAFDNTNYHLQPNFFFRINSSREKDVQLEFPVLMQYEYSKDDKVSRRVSTMLYSNGFLPQEVVDSLSKKYDEDESLPRFIKFDDSFYKKVDSATGAFIDVEKAVNENKDRLDPLKETAQQLKAKLEQTRAEYKQIYASASTNEKHVREEIEKVEKDLAMNEAILSDADTDLANNLRATISELTKRKEELENQERQSKANIESIEKAHKEQVDNLQHEIEAKKAEMTAIGQKIKEYQSEQARMKKEYDVILKSSPKNLNETVANVIKKYPQDENIFFRRVSAICIGLDKALSASDSAAYDEFAESIDTVRESYRKVLQIIFETILSRSKQTLGAFLGDVWSIMDLENECKKRQVPSGVVSHIADFHNLANAIGHLAESSGKAPSNAQKIKDFKNMPKENRQTIVLSIPEFFESINLTKSEIKTIVSRLAI